MINCFIIIIIITVGRIDLRSTKAIGVFMEVDVS